MADIVLVQPIVGNMDEIRSDPQLPLALLFSASLVVRDGYSVKLIDQRLDPKWREALRGELKKGPVCVGTTAMTGPQITGALEASRVVKESSDVPLVWGGIHASLLSRQTLSHPHIDFVVKGEGEETFLELVQALENGKRFEEILGLGWKDERGTPCINPERPFLDMNSLPDLPFHLVNVRQYLPRYLGYKTLTIQTSRGCPYPCAYCYNTTFNKRQLRELSVERSVALMAKAKELGAECVTFVDDEFVLQSKRLVEICTAMLKEGLDLKFDVQGIRVNNAMKFEGDMLHLAERAGCIRLMFGVESASERILKMVKRNIPLDHVQAINQRLAETNIIAHFNFMCGFPGETREDLKKSVEFIFSLMRDNPKCRISGMHVFTPYPGTPLYDYVVQNGYFKPPATLDGWANLDQMSASGSAYQDKEFLESLFFVSLFADRKWNEHLSNPLLRAVAMAYGPVARRRMKNLNFNFMLMNRLARLFYPSYLPKHPAAASEPNALHEPSC